MAVTPQVWQYRIIVHHVPVYRKAISGLLIDRTRIIGRQRRQTASPGSDLRGFSLALEIPRGGFAAEHPCDTIVKKS